MSGGRILILVALALVALVAWDVIEEGEPAGFGCLGLIVTTLLILYANCS